MLSLVAFIAIVNLLLGYAIGTCLCARRGRVVRIISEPEPMSPADSGDEDSMSKRRHGDDSLPPDPEHDELDADTFSQHLEGEMASSRH